MSSTLLLVLFFCHFLADYTHLSTDWMLSAKRLGKPLFPIFTHACVHGMLMGIVLSAYGEIHNIMPQVVFGLIGFQVLSHFLIDTFKGRMNDWFPKLLNPANKWHWVMFGLDQFLHAWVIISMVEIIG